jgi:hypothetical protein
MSLALAAPVGRDRSLLWLTLGVWTSCVALQTVPLWIWRGGLPPWAAVFFPLVTLSGVGLSLALHRTLARLPAPPGRARWSLVGAATIAAACLQSLMDDLIFRLVAPPFGETIGVEIDLPGLAWNFMTYAWLFGLYALALELHPARTTARTPRREPTPTAPAAAFIDCLWAPAREGRVRVAVASIDWIEAAGDYVVVHAQGRRHMLRVTMDSLQKSLDPQMILRVSRSAFVRRDAVTAVRRLERGGMELVLGELATVSVGHTYVRAMREAFGAPS